MNTKTIFTENFITDFFKKMFSKKKSEKTVYKKFEDNPKIAAKIKKLKAGMKTVEKDMNSIGYIWKPEKGGWINKKTGKTAFE